MIPLIYLGYLGAAAATAYVFSKTKGFGLWDSDTKPKGSPNTPKRRSIAVLGPRTSGKSTLQSYFRNKSHNNKATPYNGANVEEIDITHDGKTITLSKGTDVSGDDIAIRSLYEDQIKNCDTIFFIFNSFEFLHDNDKQNATLALLNFIIRKNTENKLIILIGSFADKLCKNKDTKKNREKYTNEISNIIAPHIIGLHVTELLLVSLVNKDELDIVKKNLFK